MPVTYLNTDTSGSLATNLAQQDTDIVIHKIVVGNPIAAKYVAIYDTNNASTATTAQLKFKYTYPTFGDGVPASDQFDFDLLQSGGGLHLDNGGSVMLNDALQVTVHWDYYEQLNP